LAQGIWAQAVWVSRGALKAHPRSQRPSGAGSCPPKKAGGERSEMARGGRPGGASPAGVLPEDAADGGGGACARDRAPVDRAVVEDGLRVLNTFLHVPVVGPDTRVRSSSAPATTRGQCSTPAAEVSMRVLMTSCVAEGAIFDLGPTWGSILHSTGRCRPCLFAERGCRNGEICRFCHICPSARRTRATEEKIKQKHFSWRSLRKATAGARARARGDGAPVVA